MTAASPVEGMGRTDRTLQCRLGTAVGHSSHSGAYLLLSTSYGVVDRLCSAGLVKKECMGDNPGVSEGHTAKGVRPDTPIYSSLDFTGSLSGAMFGGLQKKRFLSGVAQQIYLDYR